MREGEDDRQPEGVWEWRCLGDSLWTDSDMGTHSRA